MKSLATAILLYAVLAAPALRTQVAAAQDSGADASAKADDFDKRYGVIIQKEMFGHVAKPDSESKGANGGETPAEESPPEPQDPLKDSITVTGINSYRGVGTASFTDTRANKYYLLRVGETLDDYTLVDIDPAAHTIRLARGAQEEELSLPWPKTAEELRAEREAGGTPDGAKGAGAQTTTAGGAAPRTLMNVPRRTGRPSDDEVAATEAGDSARQTGFLQRRNERLARAAAARKAAEEALRASEQTKREKEELERKKTELEKREEEMTRQEAEINAQQRLLNQRQGREEAGDGDEPPAAEID